MGPRRDSTLSFYETNAAEVAAGYEAVDFSPVLQPVLEHLSPGTRVLEIGCGSGRDAAVLLERGCDVTATDASNAMLTEAAARHPKLGQRLLRHMLPEPLPFASYSFDAVMAMAVIMHLSHDEIQEAFGEIARVLKPHGLLAYSVNTERAGLDQRGYDDRGRYFTCLPAAEWEQLHTEAGFETLDLREQGDLSGRTGVHWVTFIARARGRLDEKH